MQQTGVPISNPVLRYLRRVSSRIPIALGLGFTCWLCAAPDPLDQWHIVTPPPTTNTVNDAVYFGTDFVAVNAAGGIMTSPDGTNWTHRVSPVNQSLSGICHGGGVVVAVGGFADFETGETSSALVSSTNGIDWTRRFASTFDCFASVTCAQGQFVAVAGRAEETTGGIVMEAFTSPNGVDWANQGPIATNVLWRVTHGNGCFVAVGEAGTVVASSNGTNWTRQVPRTPFGLYSVAYGNGRFLAVGDYGVVLSSPDGTNWTKNASAPAGWLNAITFGSGTFTACGGDGFILTSPDGATWTPRAVGMSYAELIGVAYGANRFLVMGTDGVVAVSDIVAGGAVAAFPSPPPAHSGSVNVVLKPEAANGQWRFAGEPLWRDANVPVLGLPSGNYELEFKPVSGYLQPPHQVVPVSADELSSPVAYYVATAQPSTGHLTVWIKPDSVASEIDVHLRGQWRLLGETAWRNSGDRISDLNAGLHLVEFKTVPGRATPPRLNATVLADQINLVLGTYFVADATQGTPPSVLSFNTVITSLGMPFGYNGQLRSDLGFGSGGVVRPRVVLTAAHVLFNDGALTYAASVQWLFQRDRGVYEPYPQSPRGWYVFEGYARQREADNSPGESSPASQDLDVAALYFNEAAGRDGYAGYLSSDAVQHEWLTSGRNKMLLGYPVEFVKDADQGRMHATVPFNVSFRQVTNHVFATSDITSYAGNSGGPVCVQADDGRYYPAAIYLGGSAQTVVRAIDSSVADLINRAEISSGGGPNNVGGGVGWVPGSGGASLFAPGYLQVLIQPTHALAAGGGWRLVGSGQTNYVNDNAASYGLLPATYAVEFRPAEGFWTPTNRPVTIVADQTAVLPIEYIVEPPGLTAWLGQPEQGLRLRLTGVSGLGYLIEASTNLLGWESLATNLSLASGEWEIVDLTPATLRWRFYRARSIPSQ